MKFILSSFIALSLSGAAIASGFGGEQIYHYANEGGWKDRVWANKDLIENWGGQCTTRFITIESDACSVTDVYLDLVVNGQNYRAVFYPLPPEQSCPE